MQIPTPRSSLLAKLFAIVFVLNSCLSFYVLAGQTSRQNKITIIATDITLDNVFRQIEKQTGLRFVFAVDALNVNEKVSVNFKEIVLDDALNSLLSSRNIIWQYRDGTISLKKEVAAPKQTSLSGRMQVAEPITITGRVTDANGAPVPGATIMIKNSKKGAKTDGDGNFLLSNVEIGTVLLVSCIGFETKEAFVLGKSVTVKMKEIIGRLDETVIVGLNGTTTQRFNTGNVTTIKAVDIAKQPVSDPLLALQGRVPGMTVVQTSGLAGGQVKVQIRGQNSIFKSTAPLFIVDGVPYSADIAAVPLSSFGALGGIISALNFVNPSDIESIDVLKDADATAIYGSRGANGVILITTKKGNTGNAKVDINVASGWQNVPTKMTLLNTSQYLKMRREAFKNDGMEPDIQNAPDLMLWDTTRNTDWHKTLLGGTARYTDAQASIAGGTPVVRYLIGGNFHKETTIFPGDFSSQRGGLHFNISGASPDQALKTSLTGSYTITKSDFPNLDFASYLNLPPDAPPGYNPDGTLNWANSSWSNPYAQLVGNIADAQTNNIVTNLDVSYRVLPGLILKVNIGYNELRNNVFRGNTIAGKDPGKDPGTADITASAEFIETRTRSWISEPQAAYTKELGKGTLNLLAGATLLGNKREGQRVQVDGIQEDALIRMQTAGSSDFGTGVYANNTGGNYKYIAFFGRAGYNMADKYLINLTVRRDGSSRFGPGKQFANFGAVGAAWIFSQEEFIKSTIPFLSYGKLRISYGTTGNDGVGDYEFLDRYEFVQQPYQGAKGLRGIGIYNPDFAWEITRKAELGMETGFFRNRILLSGSYYRHTSSNQLIQSPLPSMVGASIITSNQLANIRNTGLELVLSTKNIQTPNFDWTTEFNITAAHNKLLSYPSSTLTYATPGRALTVIDLYKTIGVDPTTGAYIFANGEGKPAVDGDAPFYGAASVDLAPVYFGGIQNSFRYRKLQLDVFFQYVKQKGLNGNTYPDLMPGLLGNQPVNALDRWSKEGDIAAHQRFNQNYALFGDYGSYSMSDKAYGDASFIRCKNIALSWQLPDKWKQKMHVNNSRIYMNCQNLFTIDHYAGWDPETQSLSVIPPLRVLTAGIQLTL